MINITENRDGLRYHLIYFNQSLDYYTKAYPDKTMSEYADLYLDNEISMEEGMRQYHEVLKQISKYNQRILRAIKSVKGKTFYKHFIEWLDDIEATDYHEWEIVSQPVGTIQDAGYGRSIRKEWVCQRAVGDSGDSWEGTVCVQIKKGKYLKVHFSM